MNVEEQNKAFCKEKAQGLYEAIYQSSPQYPDLLLERTAKGIKAHQGEVSAYLGSCYCRAAEFEGLFARTAEDTEIIIFFGYLAQDLLDFLRKRFRSLTHLVIVDPTSQFLQAAFQEELLTAFIKNLKNGSISLYPNLAVHDVVTHIFAGIKINDKVSVVFSVPYQTLFPAYCHSFAVKFKEQLRLTLINLCTHNLHTEAWLNGMLKNYQEEVILVKEMQPLFQGKTVILVSAGPSLEKNVHLLKEADAQAVIIAVGSSVPILNKLGIRPHFNAGIDLFQGSTFNHLQYPDVPLLFGSKIEPVTLATYQGPRIYFMTAADPLDLYLLGDHYDRMLVADSGFSIAVCIASLACRLGAKKLVFIGQDMCLYGEKLHHLPQGSDEEALQADRMDLIDIYGNPVSSLSSYWGIKSFLEGVIAKHPEVEFVNATEGGLGLLGAPNERLIQVLAELPQLEYSIKEEITRLSQTAQDVTLMDYFEEKNVIHDLEQILLTCKRIALAVENIGKLQKNKAQKKKIEKELGVIKKQMLQIEEMEIYGAINQILKGVFEPIRVRYSGDLDSKNWERRVMALVKTGVGFIIPLKEFCQLLQNSYYEYKPELDTREKKDAVSD